MTCHARPMKASAKVRRLDLGRRHRLTLLVMTLALIIAGSAPAYAQGTRSLTVFAAASLQTALTEIGGQYTAKTGTVVRFSFGGSPALARQIEQGAPADLVLTADGDWMDYLQTRRLIDPARRRNVISNALVLVAPAGSSNVLVLAPRAAAQASLAKALGRGRLAMADPDTVPAGRYGKAALISLGLWNRVAGQLAPSDSVRTALAFVARGEAPLGLVYASDAVAEPRVKVVARFAKSAHPLIVYPAGVTKAAQVPSQAAEFLDYLQGRQAQAIFVKNGFSPLPR